MNQTSKSFPGSKIKKSMLFRLKNGQINPDIPVHLRNTKWIKEPKIVETMPDNYRDALNTVAKVASAKRGMYNQQWGVWDPMRHRLSPHEAMFPGLQSLPRMSHDQFMSVRDVYGKHGFLSPGRTTALKDQPQKRMPRGIQPDPSFGPTKPVTGGPSKLAYWGLLPPAIAGPRLYDKEESRP